MAQSVSNDALWKKLSEIDRKLDRVSAEQKSSVPEEEQALIKPDFTGVKEEIITEINEQTTKLGRHNDSHFEAHRQNFQVLDENIRKVLNITSHIQKHQKESVEPEKEDKGEYFNFKFFKVRKTSFLVVILGLLIFILTLFCMKQQNDYSLLMDEYRKQDIIIQKLGGELKVLEEKQLKKQQKK